ncbi:hypothetical protein [Streptomyces sp. NPDC058701]|uniref:hypothetical protein n=1 Tax=Streptomyces sp. NPDC058701 TaxID=3346608 RepID=UPI003652FE74
MDQRTVTPQSGLAELPAPRRPASESPIYDALERQWLREGREVPRQDGPPRGGRHRADAGDLFRRA